MKHLMVFGLLLPLTACQLLPGPSPAPVEVVDEQQLCLDTEQGCSPQVWLQYWMEVAQMDWQQRKTRIKQLGHADQDKLQKILLSLGAGTPYQDRLRAKYLAQELLNKYQGPMALFIEYLLYLPSKEKLELESALTTMGRINARQASQIEQQFTELQRQKQQIQQLLKVEGQMLDKQSTDYE